MNGYPLPINLTSFQPALKYRLLQLLDQIDEPAPSDYAFHIEEKEHFFHGTIDQCGHINGTLAIFLKKLSGGILASHFDCV